MTTSKSYDRLNRLLGISSQPSASGVAALRYDYTYNDPLRKMLLSVLIPAIYGVTAFALLNLPLNKWFALHAFYVISWPASHLLAREALLVQALGGLVQWAIIGILAGLIFRPKAKS